MRVLASCKSPSLLVSSFVALLAVSACDDHGHDYGDPGQVLELLETADESRGETFFNQTCANAACHGADGDSGPAPDLTVHATAHADDEIAGLIRNGDGDMPAQSSLDDQAIADVIVYLKATF